MAVYQTFIDQARRTSQPLLDNSSYQTTIVMPGEGHGSYARRRSWLFIRHLQVRPGELHDRYSTMAVMPGEGHSCLLDICRFGQEKLMTVIRQRQLYQEKVMVVMPGEGHGCLSDIYRLDQENFMAVIRQRQLCQEKVMAIYQTSVGLVRRNSWPLLDKDSSAKRRSWLFIRHLLVRSGEFRSLGKGLGCVLIKSTLGPGKTQKG